MTFPRPGTLNEIKNESLSGLTVSFAMVPEVVAFAFVAGVNPLVGLYAAFIVGLVTAIFGGRPGMISGGAGSLAVVSTALVARHGVEYLFAAVFLMGFLQVLAGVLRWGKFIRMVPHPVVLGFVNGLAIVIFRAQLQHFQKPGADGRPHWTFDASFWIMLALVSLTVAITYLLPRLTKAIPSSLAAIIVVAFLVHGLHIPARTVGDLASIHGTFPQFHLPLVPFTLVTLKIILPYSFILAAVGLTESLLTLLLINQLTETEGDTDRECIGQGFGNLITGLFGGMGGCAMIGQSMINITSGGRRRLSGVVEALCILSFIVFASRLIESVPMAALVGVMVVVVVKTFAWSSLRILDKIPRSDAFVLILVSLVTVWTDLATAVVVGVILSALKFASENATKMTARTFDDEQGRKVYELHGPLFFASTHGFQALFNPRGDPDAVVIDFRHTRIHDHSALDAIHAVSEQYRLAGKTVTLSHLSPECREMLEAAEDFVNADISEEAHQHIATDRLK